MREILVVANRTIGGRALLEHVRELAAEGPARFRVVIPRSQPSSGLFVYDEAVRDAAQVRLDLAVSFLRQEGIEVSGEVGDPDPFYATMDAISDRRPDVVIVSTYPVTSSGWLRRDLIERIQSASGLPVSHVVVDVAADAFPFSSTLVVANRTSTGEELVGRLLEKAAASDGPHLFVVVVPQASSDGRAAQEARERLAALLDRLHGEGLMASGMIADPDPFTATVNALELFNVDDVVISTLPAQRSGWLRGQLIERVRRSSPVPVEHVVVELAATAA